ncbi:MAG: right-handed parallel beta-helix repeat-containing protein [Desulfobulbaceae bacterium]|nr:right-handed parallel beta-helix repeat-containing protein [Desulfobulbaceae bacterium]
MKHVLVLFLVLFMTAPLNAADFGSDCDVDAWDLAQFGTYMAVQNPASDLDGNGTIDSLDVALFAGRFGESGCAQEQFQYVYEVGPDKPYADPDAVPWESLLPGSLVLIHYRDEPYRSKWVVARRGSALEPIVIRGVPRQEDGKLPIISGDNATTRLELDYWNENRSVVKVGGSSSPSEIPAWITIENLEIRSGRPGYFFSDDRGNTTEYSSNAAAIHVEMGEHIIIRNCILTDSANGFFAGSQASDLLLEGNSIFDNGMEDSIYQHNNYTEALGIVFQYNHFGPLRSGCKGNNLKDRSAGTIIRYNWIEAGNRTIDLVESDHADLYTHPRYHTSYVYGNVLIKHDVVENGQVVHYGGDGSDYSIYRKGTLWFFNNTVISLRSANTTLWGLSSNDEEVKGFNNIVYTTADGSRLAIMGEKGTVELHHNWLPEDWQASHESILLGSLTAWDNLEGDAPGFVDFPGADFRLTADSPCRAAGADLPGEIIPDHNLNNQYGIHQQRHERFHGLTIDFGAFD